MSTKKQPEVRTAERWLPQSKEDARNESSSDPLDETVNRWVELGKGRQFLWGTPGDHEISPLIELISPQPSRSKRLFLQVLPEMVLKSAR